MRMRPAGSHIYPEGSSRDAARRRWARCMGWTPERIVCGFGSDDILHLLAQVYLGEGDEAVMSQYGFNVYPIITRGASAEIVMAPETDYRADVDALLPRGDAAHHGSLFLANPNNPTGTYLPAAEVERLQRGLRPRHPVRARQRLCGICDGRRLLGGHRSGRCRARMS